MKKILLVLIVCFSIATAKAQFQFGVKAGVNRSNITGFNFTWPYHGMYNYNVGVFAVLPIAKFVSFSPELLYDRKGGQNPEVGVNEWIHDDYLDIPLMIRYTDKSGLHIETGPQIGFLLSFKGQFQTDVFPKSEFNSYEIAWTFGLGYDIPHTPIGIDFRYELDMSNLTKSAYQPPSSPLADVMHNSLLQLDVRYILFKGHQ